MTAIRRGSALSAKVFNPIELVEFTRDLTADVVGGKYPYINYDEKNRWHQRIYRDPRVDVWLISWLPTQGTQLHDHGGSSGAFTVAWGELAEAVYIRSGRRAGQLNDRTIAARRSIGFDGDYVHDVRNLSDAPAVSVHAYSPPLVRMNYFDVQDAKLVRLATIWSRDSEPDLAFASEAAMR